MRRANLDGVYDNNTNLIFYPKIMQPTHATWEWIPPESETPADPEPITNGTGNNHALPNGVSHGESEASLPQNTIFSKVSATLSRNFIIVDTTFRAPPISHAGFPGPDGHVEDPTCGPNGLSTISQDLIDELPPDCREAFEQARATELGWKRQWDTEAKSGSRGTLKIGFHGYPV